MSTNSPPPPNGGSGRLAAAQQSALQSDEPSAVKPCPLKKCWIEVVLQDDLGDPIANQEYLIVGPDGAEHKGKLNSKGYVRLEGLDPGACDVSFPKLHNRVKPAWVGQD